MTPVNRRFGATAFAAGLLAVTLPASARAQANTGARIMSASSLPRLASDLRDEGVPPAAVKLALDEMRAAKVTARDAAKVLQVEYQARLKQPEPETELGVLVREQLRKGVPGQDLAAAIEAARKAKPAPAREIR